MTTRDSDKRTDLEIVQQFKHGDRTCFAVLLRRYNQKLYRIARGMGIEDLDCDDVIQQCYIQVYLNLDEFREQSAVGTWIVRILINQCLMHLRKVRPGVSRMGVLEGMDSLLDAESEDSIMTKIDSPETAMIKNELRALLERAVERLPEEYRVVYLMRETEDMSTREIAECLNLTEANVKVRLFRARKLLHSELRKYMKPEEIFQFGASRCDRLVGAVLESCEGI